MPLQPPNDCDLRRVFILFLAAAYCVDLNVDTGTIACDAVLGFFQQRHVLNRILGNMKNKFEKLGNRPHLQKSASVIHHWVHEGDAEAVNEKIKLYREMGGNLSTEVEKQMGYRIVQLLVIIAKGKPPTDLNKRGYFPYGIKPAYSTKAFKNCPSSWFSNSLTTLYPYILKERSQWDGQDKKFSHPMNATGLWPSAKVKRYMTFYTLFRANRDKLFACYEEQEGVYHGAEPLSIGPPKDTTPLAQEDVDNMSSDSSDSVDGVFV